MLQIHVEGNDVAEVHYVNAVIEDILIPFLESLEFIRGLQQYKQEYTSWTNRSEESKKPSKKIQPKKKKSSSISKKPIKKETKPVNMAKK